MGSRRVRCRGVRCADLARRSSEKVSVIGLWYAAAGPQGVLVRPKLAQGTHDSRSTDSHYLAEETQRWR